MLDRTKGGLNAGEDAGRWTQHKMLDGTEAENWTLEAQDSGSTRFWKHKTLEAQDELPVGLGIGTGRTTLHGTLHGTLEAEVDLGS